jgi:hypothetical protein
VWSGQVEEWLGPSDLSANLSAGGLRDRVGGREMREPHAFFLLVVLEIGVSETPDELLDAVTSRRCVQGNGIEEWTTATQRACAANRQPLDSRHGSCSE